MRIPAKGRYAVAALIELAMQPNDRPMTIAQLAEKQNISLSYLEQLFAELRREGLIRGARGPGGGYRLARPAEDISIIDILKAIDERVVETPAEDEAYVPFVLWGRVSQQLQQFLADISLADCVEQKDALFAARASETA